MVKVMNVGISLNYHYYKPNVSAFNISLMHCGMYHNHLINLSSQYTTSPVVNIFMTLTFDNTSFYIINVSFLMKIITLIYSN